MQVRVGGATVALLLRAMSAVRWLLDLNPWLYLLVAGVAEVGFTTFMKLSDGFRHWGFNVCFAVSALASFGLLNLATRNLSLGTAYAIWTGIGAFGTVLVGILYFGDPATLWRLLFLTTLIVSIIGLRFVS
jgi:quaternary ammonium compound-resistance protein SugE